MNDFEMLAMEVVAVEGVRDSISAPLGWWLAVSSASTAAVATSASIAPTTACIAASRGAAVPVNER